jgi:transformation/transcription domain-associated protein
LRDSAENSKDYAYYAKYLEVLIPAVVTLLGEEKTISFAKDSADQVSKFRPLQTQLIPQRLRNSLLTFIQRLPKTDPFKVHEVAVMELAIKLLRVENEENALVCIKIMIDAFRNHRVRSPSYAVRIFAHVRRIRRSRLSRLSSNA